ncbi:divalent-cation tolerance protein CutA [Methylicorpusculum oleiharenae]|uniref:divalent-cation tolerance protein CutA n=1 Tax=Methylicorpusculum oleiharenae TaxID=1338687 RepID=UPI001357DEB3|nr:divalent-cation tolerance protein CutA [Methylicorpusculum oleiharenae]MCD2450681.1 divalent-cation tolerance protein CutA [Methylicorpusculum oleiharenae]
MSQNYQIIFCTCPDQQTATKLAHLLINQNLAACVNLLPGLTSVYRWQDKIETANEHLLLIKTRADFYSRIAKLIKCHHPYELPEIIAVTVDNGAPDYLQWIDQCLTSE